MPVWKEHSSFLSAQLLDAMLKNYVMLHLPWCYTLVPPVCSIHGCILQLQSQNLCSSRTFPDRDCHTTASALQTDKQVPGQSVLFEILHENSSLLSKVSWNIFYSIVASLDKRASRPFTWQMFLLWELLPSSQDGHQRKSMLKSVAKVWDGWDQLLCYPCRLSDQSTIFPA